MKPITKAIKATRRAAAEARQAKYNAMPMSEKLAKAGKKEKAKLLAKAAS